ncbi:hypothetical protein CsSME_00009117 [Camellia sinensis var. sinensis]
MGGRVAGDEPNGGGDEPNSGGEKIGKGELGVGGVFFMVRLTVMGGGRE